jgi:hypothetical protein
MVCDNDDPVSVLENAHAAIFRLLLPMMLLCYPAAIFLREKFLDFHSVEIVLFTATFVYLL